MGRVMIYMSHQIVISVIKLINLINEMKKLLCVAESQYEHCSWCS